MRTFMILLGAIVLGGAIGYGLGNAFFVTSTELEEVADLFFWTAGGAVVSLLVAAGTVAAARSSRGRDDL
jgi:hypothetical protein